MNNIFYIAIYPFNIMISFDESDAQMKKACKILKVIPGDDEIFNFNKVKTKFHGRSIIFEGCKIILRLNFIPDFKDPDQIGLLQHEIFHVCHFIMSDIDTPLTSSTSEPYAYFIQYLTSIIFAFLNENN